MSLVYNERTKLWTRERLGTVYVDEFKCYGVEDVILTGCYVRYWKEMSLQLRSGLYESLNVDPSTRRCVVFMVPDPRQDFWPCLVAAQFMIRENRLVCFFYWRSSSDREREGDNEFMRFVGRAVWDQVAHSRLGIDTVTVMAFRASDHEILPEDSYQKR